MPTMNRHAAPRLSRRRMEAIQEALIHRLAGEIEEASDGLAHRDYEAALAWITGKLHLAPDRPHTSGHSCARSVPASACAAADPSR